MQIQVNMSSVESVLNIRCSLFLLTSFVEVSSRGKIDLTEASAKRYNNRKVVENIMINSIEKPIELPIEQKHTGKGNPNAVLTFGVELNNRQKDLLEKLSEFDSKVIVDKKSVNMADLSALTAHTGDEFALFTKGKDRLIIRGNSLMVKLDIEQAKKLAAHGYRWSGHTHPGIDINVMMPSTGDKEILKCFSQNSSVIYDSKGNFRTFEKG